MIRMAVAMVALVGGVGALAQGYQQHTSGWGRETPGKCGAKPATPPTIRCTAPDRPTWVCRVWLEGYGENLSESGNGWVEGCARPRGKAKK